MPPSTIKSVIAKCKEFGTTVNLSRGGRPPKLWAKRAFIREISKRQSLKELESNTAKIVCPQGNFKPYTPQSWATHELCKSGQKKVLAERK